MSATSDSESLAARLTALCSDTALPWLEPLRAAERELGDAGDGRGWAFSLLLGGLRPLRLGILPSGQVVCPLGDGGTDDAQLVGSAHEAARFALGEGRLEDAMATGLLVLPTASVPLDGLVRLRRVVAERLRAFVETMPAAVWFVHGFRHRYRVKWAWWSGQIVEGVSIALAGATAAACLVTTGPSPDRAVTVNLQAIQQAGYSSAAAPEPAEPPNRESVRVDLSQATPSAERLRTVEPAMGAAFIPETMGFGAELGGPKEVTGDMVVVADIPIACNSEVRELLCTVARTPNSATPAG